MKTIGCRQWQHGNFNDYLARQKRRWGKKFDPSELNKEFIPYFENQQRIEVDFGYETKRGRIGVTTGWCPCFLLMLTKRSIGSCYIIDKNDKVLRVVGE
jgi:hypothetical protein